MLGLPIFAMLPNDYPELYDCYSEGKLLATNSNLGKHIAKLALKLAILEEEKRGAAQEERFRLFG